METFTYFFLHQDVVKPKLCVFMGAIAPNNVSFCVIMYNIVLSVAGASLLIEKSKTEMKVYLITLRKGCWVPSSSEG